MFNVASIVIAASIATAAIAHTITLTNHCGSGVPVYVDNAYSPVPYTGGQPGTIGAGASVSITLPVGWNSRICHNSDGANCADGVNVDSMAEFNVS
ncbi:hypothetical protein HWV62_35438 [Athelia sp. TMB]|nr:hypothetical protein HWV62_35438 [Athelia sp. TMB]